MRTAVISDIHGNKDALEKVLSDIKSRGCDDIVCLGDVVGYGYDPNGCIDLVRKECSKCIMGNHDAGVVCALGLDWYSATARDGVLRDRKRVPESGKAWIRDLDYQHTTNPCNGFYACFSHGTYSYPNEFEYIESIGIAGWEMRSMKQAKVNILFVGHTHLSAIYESSNGLLPNELHNDGMHKIDPKKQTIVNVGSVGYPRNQPFTSYAILEVNGKDDICVEFVRLPFDFKGYCAKMRESWIRVPNWMAKWIPEYVSYEDTGFEEENI